MPLSPSILASRSDAMRTAVVEALNPLLADAVDLYLAAWHAHVNLRGMAAFVALHELLGRVVDALREDIDEIAERIAQLGGVATLTLQGTAEATRLPAMPGDQTGLDAVTSTATRMAVYIRHASRARRPLQNRDPDTYDLLTKQLGELEKLGWLVVSSLEPSEAERAMEAARQADPSGTEG